MSDRLLAAYNMNIFRFKIMVILLLAFGLSSGVFAYVKYKKFSEYLISRINLQTGKKLGRQIKFKRIAFSPLKGVVIYEPCVSRAPDFSKGIFFCARRAIIRPEIAQLMRNRLYFSNVELTDPVIKAREAGGKWDFDDLLALLPRTSKGLHITWNARKLSVTGAKLEVDIGSSGRSIAIENADITLLHYSALAGNFELKLNGDVKTILNGQLLTARTSFKTDLNFEYSGLTAAFGDVQFTGAALGAATIKKTSLSWEIFNIDKPAREKNYTAGLKAEGLFIPAQSGAVKQSVNSAMELLSSVIGKATPRVEDIEMDELTLDFTLNNGVLFVKRLDLNTNFLNLKNEYELNGPARTVNIRFAAQIGDNRLDLTAKGPMDRPDILPAMSVTLNRKLTEAIRGINASLLKIFPILEVQDDTTKKERSE
ncbi:MAG: hypothetical protein A2270_03525 [Elusimicrobia bacterium RIFOXYA12_FULL_51_18]|nr:MAG: hypothetical protein A2270_03525 [Elusimicrobia bacterium RIFOXYA12_FULL_51_18]OGS31915.1 MAG: hypothetical protein A2218_06490 [Elusimicrobia bacterium RIFOXYA2_FULL_53_38]